MTEQELLDWCAGEGSNLMMCAETSYIFFLALMAVILLWLVCS